MNTRPQTHDAAGTASGRFHAIVLAGDRTAGDPVAAVSGAAAKALTRVAGREMVLRVLDALAASESIGRITLCGPRRDVLPDCPELLSRIESGAVGWIECGASPSRSAAAGLETVPAAAPVLLTTADHALLNARIVTHFCRGALESGADAVAGLAEFECVAAAMPGTRRTVMKFRDRGYCGCNLYAFLSPAGRGIVPLWRGVEESRKRPWRMIAGLLGPATALAYAAGRLTLEEALKRLSHRLGFQAQAVVLPFPEAAVDVDTVADLDLAERLLGGAQSRGTPA